MASIDKALARVSAGVSLVALAGVAIAPLLPMPRPARTAAPPAEKSSSPAPSVAAAPAPQSPQATTDTAKGAESAPAKPVEENWTDAQQAAGLRECLRVLAPVAVEIENEVPMKHGQCGSPAPLILRSVGGAAKVEFDPAPMLNCRLAAELAHWIERVLQPAAREVLGSRVTRIVGASSYSCRNVYNSPKLPLSEHASGNAVDIVGFVTADGRSVSVARGWGPTERDIAAAQKKLAEAAKKKAEARGAESKPDSRAESEPAAKDARAEPASEAEKVSGKEKAGLHKAGLDAAPATRPAVVPATASVTAAKTIESTFLKRLHRGACSMFSTVLGPEANEAHRDHFHFDLKERSGPRICH